MSYIIYCRKSSESEERQILSIESQMNELKELADRLKLNVSEILTESRSAKSPGRPVFNAMMKKIYGRQVKGIIVWKLDRLARNPIDGSSLVWALDQGNISEIVTPINTFLNNSNDKFLMQLEFGMAKKYVDDLSDNVKRGNRAKLEKGWFPGLPPLGYLNEPKERTIIPDPERFLLIRKMWNLLLQGMSPLKILKTVNEEWGFKTRTHKKSGGKPLSRACIYKIFGNSFYYGLIERKEGVFQGKHEPMITEEEYWKVQEILGRKGRPRPKKHQFAFTGLIRCGECGCMVTAEEKENRYGYHYTYYHCTWKKRGSTCRQKSINLTNLELQVLEYLDKIYVSKTFLNPALEYLEKMLDEENKGCLDIQRTLEKAAVGCQTKLHNLNQMRFKDLIDDSEYLGEKKKLIEEKMRIEKRLKEGINYGRRAVELTEKTLIFANEGRETFRDGLSEDKRDVLQWIGSNLFLKDKKLTIQAKKPLLILEEGLRGIDKEMERLEPEEYGVNNGQNGLSLALFQRLCSREDSNL
ncbi:MAG: recombinase family protein [Candidatus Paceibacterota bacterium]